MLVDGQCCFATWRISRVAINVYHSMPNSFRISCVLIVFNCPVSVFLSFLEYGWHRNPSKAFYQAFQSGSRLRESKALSDRYSTVLVWPRLIWTSVAFVCHLWLQALLTAHAWLQCGQDVFISSFYSHVIMSFQEMFRGFEGQRRVLVKYMYSVVVDKVLGFLTSVKYRLSWSNITHIKVKVAHANYCLKWTYNAKSTFPSFKQCHNVISSSFFGTSFSFEFILFSLVIYSSARFGLVLCFVLMVQLCHWGKRKTVRQTFKACNPKSTGFE